ncbi:MAG: carboxypeptidase regulatory-like domain-containing protein [Alphaproteobacteria bacterium]|nr:carboxypeptidase regulatory-like domain-containing protein [Alphaproteobacteria bacterium]
MARAPLLLAALLPLPLFLACGEPARISGTVTDVWGQPIEGATVAMEGVTKQVQTDAEGGFSFEAPSAPTRVKAGKEGYIQNWTTAQPLPEGDEDAAEALAISLYPEPDHTGFYAVGLREYHELPAQMIATRGTELRAYTGLEDIGDDEFQTQAPMRFVFSSTLRRERIAQLDLRLHKLEFIDNVEIPGVLGDARAEVELWIADGAEIPYDLEGLPSRDDFLITPRSKLKKGVYAFHTQGALSSADYEALDKIPKELRKAYVFEVP